MWKDIVLLINIHKIYFDFREKVNEASVTGTLESSYSPTFNT